MEFMDMEKFSYYIFLLYFCLNGIAFANNYKERVRFSGRIHSDLIFNDNNKNGEDPYNLGLMNKNYNNIQLGSVMLNVDIKLSDNNLIIAKVEGAKNGISMKEFYLKYNINNKLYFMFGQSAIPSSLEASTSFNRIMLNTYSIFSSSKLFESYSNGVISKYTSDYFGTFFGLYGNSINDDIKKIGKIIFITRLFANPYRNDNNLVHLGINFYNENRKNFKELEPEVDNSSVYSLRYIQRIGGEFAINYSFFNFQSEYKTANLTPDKLFDGKRKKFSNIYNFYTELNLNLTGETLLYKEGAFNFFRVKNPINKNGYGAFGLSFRFSKTNINDKKDGFILDYGKYEEYATAINWTPVSHLRFTFQYTRMNENLEYKNISNKYNLFHLKMRFYF